MKILYVINSMGTGGAERSTAEMLPILREQGIETIVAFFNRRHEGVEELVRSRGFDLRFIGEKKTWKRARALRKLITEERPDVVHTALFDATIAGAVAAVGTGVPVIASLVNMPYERARRDDPNIKALKLEAVRLIETVTGRALVDRFHAITHAVKDASVTSLSIAPGKISVVERGRDPERLGLLTAERRARVRASLGIAEDAEVVTNVGRQEFQKGQKYLLEAFAQIARVRPNAVLCVAGRTGNASADLDALLRELNLGDRIRFLGHRDDVPDVLAAADVFVLSSLWEGLGGVVLEAMGLGLPIVSTDLPPVREIVHGGQAALLVPPGDASALAQAVIRLLEDRPMALRLAARGAGIFTEKFTLARATSRMVDLYRTTIDARPSHSSARVVGRP